MTLIRRALVVAVSLTLVGCGSSEPKSDRSAEPNAGIAGVAKPGGDHQPADVVGGVLSTEVLTSSSAQPAALWVVSDFYGSATSEGEIQLNRISDGVEAKVNWRKAGQYDDYVEDRSDLGRSTTASVLGKQGLVYAYSADDHTVLRPVEGGSFIEVRLEGVGMAGFRDFLDSLRFVSAENWAEAIAAAGLKADAEGNSVPK